MEKSINPPRVMPARIDRPSCTFKMEAGSVNYVEELGPNGTPRALWMD